MSARSPSKSLPLSLALLACVLPAVRAAEPPAPAGAPTAAYAEFGAIVARGAHLAELNLSEAQFAAFVAGLRSVRDGGALPPLDAADGQALAALQQRVAQLPNAPAPAHDDRLAQYLRSARQDLQMHQSDSGLLYRIDHYGGGPRPRASDVIVINLLARTPDLENKIPGLSRSNLRTKVSDLLPGLAEGVQMMALGARALFILPPTLSFGTGAWPSGLEPGMPLPFEIELVEVVPAEDPAR
ncbi:MAG TPA: FKBP-type peptidyl-prolyl cis-trans isomerase [Opitutus sp.]|nr:FKBP-type peptidyl-prolyl cis-trans isomerase [Opitutus sp.]